MARVSESSPVEGQRRGRPPVQPAAGTSRGRLVPAGSSTFGEGVGDLAGRTSSGLEAITITTADDRATYRRGVNAVHILPLPDGLHVWRMNYERVDYPWDQIIAIDRPPEVQP